MTTTHDRAAVDRAALNLALKVIGLHGAPGIMAGSDAVQAAIIAIQYCANPDMNDHFRREAVLTALRKFPSMGGVLEELEGQP